ncbi:MAG: hypothetical protein J5983_05010 [Ruminococcus sp.]|nr:hypothetical protein [Ruminococcus sp.]
MYLKDDVNISDFLASVIKCQEAVFFYSQNGDTLNLNSILSQYFFMTLVAESDTWKKGRIHCQLDEDYELLKEYLYKNDSV